LESCLTDKLIKKIRFSRLQLVDRPSSTDRYLIRNWLESDSIRLLGDQPVAEAVLFVYDAAVLFAHSEAQRNDMPWSISATSALNRLQDDGRKVEEVGFVGGT
jgi:hypothetical protein